MHCQISAIQQLQSSVMANQTDPLSLVTSPPAVCFGVMHSHFVATAPPSFNFTGCSVSIYTGPVTTTVKFDHSSTIIILDSESDIEQSFKCVFNSYMYTTAVLFQHVVIVVGVSVLQLCLVVHWKKILGIISFDSFEKNHNCPATLMHPRVHGCTLASKAPLSLHGICPLCGCGFLNAHALQYMQNCLYCLV